MKKIILIFTLLLLSISIYANPTYTYKYINNSTSKVKLEIKYPIFKGNEELVKIANKGVLEIVKPVISDNKNFLKIHENKKGYYNTFYATVTRCDKKIISVLFVSRFFADDIAHDLPQVQGVTFGVINGKTKKLTINDVYNPKKAANDIFYVWTHSKNKPNDVENNTITKKDLLNEKEQRMLNNFTISKNYITFYRSCYEFSAYCDDWDYVKLPYNKFK